MSLQITEPLPSVPVSNYVHGGRGGAGNYRRVDPSKRVTSTLATSSRPTSVKSASHAIYSCGRGGAGNMYPSSERAMFSFDEELTRERAREEDAAPVFHVGRGGAGNFAKKRDSEDGGSSRNSEESARSGIEQIWGKISGTFSRS